ncbi:thiolase C-terminal domain-containing protein [Ramlibacter sp.]|uniref:thiolase C-terminal domain-containing protein n=1 Tax=Ramlibacter sp. TaxID=1917967 RepID=UPI003D105AA4
MDATLRGKAAIVGVGETTYYRHGQSPDPEFKLALKAILRACEDAGVDPRSIDGFASYSNDRNDPSRLAAALGIRELRYATMQWGGGGGGGAAAVGNAAAAIASGMAERVIVFRALNQGQFGRFGQGAGYGQDARAEEVTGEEALRIPYGVITPAQRHVLKVNRFLSEAGIGQDALMAIALASYHHAQNNPRAIMYGKPLDEAMYRASRWIVEPFHLYDCCQENDGAAALLVVRAEAARDLAKKPAYLLAAAAGSHYRCAATGFNVPDLGSAGFKTVAPRLYAMAGLTPADVDVVQSYEHFTGGVVMSLIEHGFFRAEEAGDFLRFENLQAPHGRLPLNTSGGNLAECYMHGLGLFVEAVRQLRGESCNPVRDAKVALVSAGPLVTPVSDALLGTEDVL